MKISKDTMQVLQNFSRINLNILLTQGNRLRTMSVSKTILAEANLAESFPVDFGIYDLAEFLGILNLFNDCELQFDNEGKVLTIKGDTGKVKYFAASPNTLVYPQKEVNPPEWDFQFNLKKDQLAQIQKAAGALGSPDLILEVDGDSQQLIVSDSANKSANSFTLDVAPQIVHNGLEDKHTFIWKIETLTILSDDYTVSLSTKNITHFEGNTANYWISLVRQ